MTHKLRSTGLEVSFRQLGWPLLLSKQFELSESVSCQSLLLHMLRKGGNLTRLISFRDFLKPLNCFLPKLNKFPSRKELFDLPSDYLCVLISKMEDFIPEETVA